MDIFVSSGMLLALTKVGAETLVIQIRLVVVGCQRRHLARGVVVEREIAGRLQAAVLQPGVGRLGCCSAAGPLKPPGPLATSDTAPKTVARGVTLERRVVIRGPTT